MKKRIIGVMLTLTLVIALSLGGCGSKTEPAPAPAPDGGDAKTEEPATASDSQEDWIDIEYKYATYLPDANPMAKITIGAINEELEKQMDGKVKITVYPSGSLLGQNDIYDGILNGTCDLGLIDYGTVMNRFPVTQLFFYPGVLDNPRAITVSQVFTEWSQTSNAPELQDTVFIWGTGNGPMCFYSKEPIASLSDLAGKQFRASAVYGEELLAYGATPVSMDTSEVYEAMRNGMIEGLYSVLPAAANTNLDEVGHYALINSNTTIVNGTVMSKAAFEKMPPSQQEVFMKCVKDAFDRQVTAMEENEKVGRILECVQNSEVTFLEGAALDSFVAASNTLLDPYVASLDEQGLDGTGELAKIRELTAKYSETYSWQDYKDNFFNDTFLKH